MGRRGLNELPAWHKQASAHRIPLRIVAAQRKALRPIEMAGLKPVLGVYPDLQDALRS